MITCSDFSNKDTLQFTISVRSEATIFLLCLPVHFSAFIEDRQLILYENSTDKLATTLVSIDPDGTAVVHPTYDKEGIMVKKLAAYGGMAGLRTRVAKREELSERKMSAQQKFNRSYEKMAGVWAPKKI